MIKSHSNTSNQQHMATDNVIDTTIMMKPTTLNNLITQAACLCHFSHYIK